MRAPERREQLLDIALELIVEKGFNALTMDAVARAADVSRPVVYKQFADVADLQHAVLDREEQRALEDLARSIPWKPGDADPDDVALDAIRRFPELFARMLLEFAQASARLVLTEPREYEVERIVRFGATMLAGLPRGEPNLDAPPPAVDRPDTWSRHNGG